MSYYRNFSDARVTGTRSNINSKTALILAYLDRNGECSKYDIVTRVLKVNGDRQKLRGYYSDWFAMARNGGIISLTDKGYVITAEGRLALAEIRGRESAKVS